MRSLLFCRNQDWVLDDNWLELGITWPIMLLSTLSWVFMLQTYQGFNTLCSLAWVGLSCYKQIKGSIPFVAWLGFGLSAYKHIKGSIRFVTWFGFGLACYKHIKGSIPFVAWFGFGLSAYEHIKGSIPFVAWVGSGCHATYLTWEHCTVLFTNVNPHWFTLCW